MKKTSNEDLSKQFKMDLSKVFDKSKGGGGGGPVINANFFLLPFFLVKFFSLVLFFQRKDLCRVKGPFGQSRKTRSLPNFASFCSRALSIKKRGWTVEFR